MWMMKAQRVVMKDSRRRWFPSERSKVRKNWREWVLFRGLGGILVVLVVLNYLRAGTD
jgi:hypothetical protein